MGHTDIQKILNPDIFAKYFEVPFRASLRNLIEFLIIVSVLVSADPSKYSLVIGASISVLGEMLRVWTSGYGYKAGEFILQGPYRFVRHPYFLGTVLLFVGICVIGRNPYAFGFAIVALTLVFRSQLNRDEKIQAKELGPKYDAYRSEVAAFIPQLIPLKSSDNAQFSLEKSLLSKKHRELDALLALVVTFGILYLCWNIPQKGIFHFVSLIAISIFIVTRLIYVRFSKRKRPVKDEE